MQATREKVHQQASDCKTAVNIYMTFILMKSNSPLYSLTKSKCHWFMFLLITLKVKTFVRHKISSGFASRKRKKLPFLHLQ